MVWILNDRTEIEIDSYTSQYDLFKTMNTREDLWALVDTLNGKDLSTFSINDGIISHDFEGMVFIGIHLFENGLGDMVMNIRFGADVIEANKRLTRENERLIHIVEESADKVEGYDILVSGQQTQ